METKKRNYLRLIELQRKEKAFEESVLIADRCSKIASAMYICFTLLKDFQEEFDEVFCANVAQLSDLRRKSKALEKPFSDYLSYLDKVWKFKSMVDAEACVQVAERCNDFVRELTQTKGWGMKGEQDNYGVNQTHLRLLIDDINKNYKKEQDALNERVEQEKKRIINI